MPDACPPIATIKINLLSRFPAELWQHQCPGGICRWGNCEFSFNGQLADYDWLVVYDDVPPQPGERRIEAEERLACASNHTLLVTTEPSTIKSYGMHFTRQFGAVITSQEAWALPHHDRIFSHPGLHWFYGTGSQGFIPFDSIENRIKDKPLALSMVFSAKRQRHTLHHKRFDFMHELMRRLPDLHVYGRGYRPLDDKAEALDGYRYHIAIENYIGPHHWTEKLADAFLGQALPFYCGCPNLADYFPVDSYIAIDLKDPEGAARIIRAAIANNEYEKRLPAILEARRRVLYVHNFFALVAREIEKRHDPNRIADDDSVIYSRHALRSKNLSTRISDLYGKTRARLVHLARGS